MPAAVNPPVSLNSLGGIYRFIMAIANAIIHVIPLTKYYYEFFICTGEKNKKKCYKYKRGLDSYKLSKSKFEENKKTVFMTHGYKGSCESYIIGKLFDGKKKK